MSEIEVGEYIRTNDGIIGKLKRIELDNIDKSLKWYVFTAKIPDKNIIDEVYINKPYIIKHSKNIIDLIEIYDYVNYFPVFDIIAYNDGRKEIRLSNGNILGNKNIETIWTKEQLKTIEYNI